MHERFEDFIEQSQLKGESIFLVLFDLDRFKEINDTLGHHFGDQVLHSLASRIQSIFDDSNAEVFRLGGDEFAVLFSTTHSIDELLELVRSHVQQLRNTLFIESISLSIGASVGIAAYPEHGNDSHELLRTADVAMYHAKRLGLGVSIYNKQFDSHSTEQLSLASELNNAVQLHQLVLHYQPKIDIRSGKTIGFEALVRWRHPSRGLLFPDKFIGLVEMSELIHSFTREIISLAVSDKKILHEKGYLQPVAINLSPRNLFNESCLQDLLLLLDQHDLKSNEIEIELTESAVMDDPDHAISLLQRFQDKNIHIAIDDFGTGYSSLAYLRRLPVSALKIDRSFVMDMVNDSQDRAIVKSTIALAHSIELNVIAEGVENDEILDLLGKMGCDTAQGYGISKPLPLEQLLEWLEDSGTIRPGLFT
jgi:diguanylate cyclase (GGDEF)-like protein